VPATGECVVCHSHPEILGASGEERPELVVTLDQIRASVHPTFACTTCHSSLTSAMHEKRDVALGSCANCHDEEAGQLAEGKHGSPQEGVALTCVTCHGNHSILDPHSEAFELRMTTACAACHNEMGQRFFGGNPFGMETHLGRTDLATCWDCHRAHLVLDQSDPRSPVNPANLLTTCRGCHPDGPPNFADIQIHVASSPLPDDPRLRAVTLYMLFMLVFTFGFFGYHTYLQIKHERRRRAAQRGSV
jgi:hypothetical protein